MATAPKPKKSFADWLMSLNRQTLYLILILASAIPLFFRIPLPDQPDNSSVDFYKTIMDLPANSTVLLSSDWTLSTRGESRGEFDAVVKLLMRRHIKFIVYSISDAQAPQVAVDEIRQINADRVARGEPAYRRWDDWISGGYFPNADGTAAAMAINLRKAFAGKQDLDNGTMRDIFQSPVLQGRDTLATIPLLIGIESTAVTTTYIQKLSGRIKIIYAVTGVMGPESLPYYTSGQTSGVAIGLKGVLDLESMMEYGLNVPDASGKIHVKSDHYNGQIPGFPGQANFGQGLAYFPALHASLAVLVLAVVAGNIGMFLQKGKKR